LFTESTAPFHETNGEETPMSWIDTVPYLLVSGNTETVKVGNYGLRPTDFMGYLDGFIDDLIRFTKGYGTQGAGPTPVAIWHAWMWTTEETRTTPAQMHYPRLAKPFMGSWNCETDSATPSYELGDVPLVSSTAKADMVAHESNQDESRLYMWAASLNLFDANVGACAPHANWILLQGQNPLHNGGPPNFSEEMQPRIAACRNANPVAQVMVQVSVTLGESSETILEALHTLDANPPDGISIYAGGIPDNSDQARELIQLLRSS
jgi:hypothetical protein